MADSSVSIDQGTTTAIDTRTEATNGNHRQVVVIGDPSVNAGVCPVDVAAGLKVDLGADNDVTITSSALPTGAATSANQATEITSLSSIDGKITACNTGAVTISAALPAGTNAIGKLAANSGVDIGDVDVTSLPALAAGTNNIGDVDVLTLPALPAGTNNIGDVDVLTLPAIPAGTNLIGYVGHGKTIKFVTGTVSADTDIVAAVASKRIKVIAYGIYTSATTANTITFQSNASTAVWTVPIQAITGTVMGANLAVAAPSFLFATVAGEKLTLDVSAAQSVTYNISYFDDDAT